MRSLSLSKQALLLLLIGMAIRLPSLVLPISEGYRNAQTATLTAGMIENGQLRPDAIAPWRGDLDARLAMELPLYNLTALAIDALPGVRLDMAGRITSLISWILSFIALQALWRRTLPPKAALWANLLFIFSPMNWYLSTAFMPESLLQLLAIVFMTCTLDYARKGAPAALVSLSLTALLGLLVKFPSFVHLGLFACLIIIDRHGWRSLFRPALISAGLTILFFLSAWGEYVKAVNDIHFQEWAGWANIVGFIRPDASRLSPGYWLPFLGYNTAFTATAVSIPFIFLGLWKLFEESKICFRARVWIYLTISLFVSWLVWGKGAPAQHYYNLPNLVLCCAAFGTGVTFVNRRLFQMEFPVRALRILGATLAVSMVLLGLAGYRYLSRPDSVTVAVAEWVFANVPAGQPVAYQPRHAPGVIDYQHQPLLSHLTGRRTWILVRSTPSTEVERALTSNSCLVVTHPIDSAGWLEHLRQQFKGTPRCVPESLLSDRLAGYRIVEDNPFFTAGLRNHDN
jgi:hypothetical protein